MEFRRRPIRRHRRNGDMMFAGRRRVPYPPDRVSATDHRPNRCLGREGFPT